MAFPSNPSKGDTYVTDDTTWTYNGLSWDRTIIGSNNSTSYASSPGVSIPSGGTTGQILQRAAGGGLEWGDGGGLDLTALLTRVSALETQLAALQSIDNLIL